jgi:hypothetical protein
MMKKLLLFLVLVVSTALAVPALAQPVPAPVCSGPPIATGTAGAKNSAPPNATYITSFYPWSASERYSIKVWRDDGTPRSYKLSFGADSGIVLLQGSDCFTIDGAACSAFTGDRITQLHMGFTQAPDGTPVSRIIANGVKVGELYGAAPLGAFNTGTVTFSDGLARIRQDTGANSRFYFEGWDVVGGVATWKSINTRFFGLCSSIAMLREQRRREQQMLATVGFSLMPDEHVVAQWWETLG